MSNKPSHAIFVALFIASCGTPQNSSPSSFGMTAENKSIEGSAGEKKVDKTSSNASPQKQTKTTVSNTPKTKADDSVGDVGQNTQTSGKVVASEAELASPGAQTSSQSNETKTTSSPTNEACTIAFGLSCDGKKIAFGQSLCVANYRMNCTSSGFLFDSACSKYNENTICENGVLNKKLGALAEPTPLPKAACDLVSKISANGSEAATATNAGSVSPSGDATSFVAKVSTNGSESASGGGVSLSGISIGGINNSTSSQKGTAGGGGIGISGIAGTAKTEAPPVVLCP